MHGTFYVHVFVLQDAGATGIDVRLGNYGADLIEVADNGSGIESGDLDSLCIRHATSKITTFKDLEGVQTFGFRGEALASLCACCSSVEVVTRTSDDEVATCLTYGHDGAPVQQKAHARNVGTTVKVQGLFARLPVRQADFLRGGTRHMAKALQQLQAYAVAAP